MVHMVATLDEFKQTLSSNELVVVDFTASWCPPCQFIGPKFVELAGQTPAVTFIKVDVDENGDTASHVGISCMPTFMFYRGGQKVDELQGADLNTLKAKVAALQGK